MRLSLRVSRRSNPASWPVPPSQNGATAACNRIHGRSPRRKGNDFPFGIPGAEAGRYAKYDSLEFRILKWGPLPSATIHPLRRHDERTGHPLALMLEADITVGAGHGELVGEGLARRDVARGKRLGADGHD